MKHIIKCRNPRCRRYIATLEILVSPGLIYVPHIKGAKELDIAQILNVRCYGCGMKTDVTLTCPVSDKPPVEEKNLEEGKCGSNPG